MNKMEKTNENDNEMLSDNLEDNIVLAGVPHAVKVSD
jgi:hypothetical protein